MLKCINKSSKYLVALSIATLFSACGSIENSDSNIVNTGDAQYIDAVVIEDVNTTTMLQVIKQSIDANATNAFGYKAVKITYNTKGQNDEDVVASGLLVIPTASAEYQAYLASLGKAFSVSMLCDNHGTMFTDAEAPTNVEIPNGLPDYAPAVLMTGYAGFAAILPDYIGYGESDDVSHPYFLKKSTARASLDMIKASMKYMNDNKTVLNYQLFVSGYSQGGHATMAVAQEIESSFSGEVNLKGIAPMAGPHDLGALGDIEMDANHTMIYPAFLGYLADSYSYYHDEIDLDTLVTETNTTMFHDLFDGSKKDVEIHAALGLTINNGFAYYKADVMFKDSFLNDYKNNVNNAVRVRFAQNDTYDWKPRTKVNLIHCVEDEIVPFSMSQLAYDTMIENGVSSSEITLTPIPTSIIPPPTATNPFVHTRCGNTAYGAAVSWFAAIRSGEIK